MRQLWDPRMNPITSDWWDIKPRGVRRDRRGLDKYDNKESPGGSSRLRRRVESRRWQDRSAMHEHESPERRTGARATRITGSPAKILYIGPRVDNRPDASPGNWRLYRGSVKPRTKVTRGGRHGELTNRSAINMLILARQSRAEPGNRRNCIAIMARTALSARIVYGNNRRLINAEIKPPTDVASFACVATKKSVFWNSTNVTPGLIKSIALWKQPTYTRRFTRTCRSNKCFFVLFYRTKRNKENFQTIKEEQ